MRSNKPLEAEERPISPKAPAWKASLAVMLLIAYAVALFAALTFSINWLVWVLVALGMGIGIPVLLLSGISFALWIQRKARAKGLNDREIVDLGMTATEGCLGVFFAILELLSHW
jgi:uncharacterized membrane protein YqjE